MVKPTILPDLKSQSGKKFGKITIVFLDSQGVLCYIPVSGEGPLNERFRVIRLGKIMIQISLKR